MEGHKVWIPREAEQPFEAKLGILQPQDLLLRHFSTGPQELQERSVLCSKFPPFFVAPVRQGRYGIIHNIPVRAQLAAGSCFAVCLNVWLEFSPTSLSHDLMDFCP